MKNKFLRQILLKSKARKKKSFKYINLNNFLFDASKVKDSNRSRECFVSHNHQFEIDHEKLRKEK